MSSGCEMQYSKCLSREQVRTTLNCKPPHFYTILMLKKHQKTKKIIYSIATLTTYIPLIDIWAIKLFSLKIWEYLNGNQYGISKFYSRLNIKKFPLCYLYC